MAPARRHAAQLPADRLRLDAAARGEIRRLNALHRGIRGRGYAARDPVLALWVHATLIDSTIVGNDAWLGPLPRAAGRALLRGDAADRPGLRRAGRRCCPRDLDAFEAYMAERLAPGGGVHVTDTARELADDVLHPPLPGLLARLPLDPRAYGWTLWPAVGLLPPSVRDGYGLRWGRRERLVADWLVAGWRAWNPLLPRSFRQMPQALAADRRVGSVELREARPEQLREIDRGPRRRASGAACSCRSARSGVAATYLLQRRPERRRAHPPARLVEQVAALDVDDLVVARARVAVDRIDRAARSSSASRAACR